MYRILLLIVICLSTCICFAQPKTLKGLGYSTLNTSDAAYVLSKNKNMLAIDRGLGDYWILNVDSLSFVPFHTGRFLTSLAKKITPDFTGGYGIAVGTEGSSKYFSSYITISGSTKPKLLFSDSVVILGMSNNYLFVSNSWTVKDKEYGREVNKIGGFAGLWTADLLTGRKLNQLRRDTLCKNRYGFSYLPEVYVDEKILIMRSIEDEMNNRATFFPFGTDSVIVRSFWKGSALSTYDKPLYCPKYNGQENPYCCTGCEYIEADHSLYFVDRNNLTVSEMNVEANALQPVKKYVMNSNGENGVQLDKEQSYKFVMMKDLSLAIIPLFDKEKEEHINNVGYLVDLTSGKVKLKIAPFFYRDAAALARIAQVAQENMEYAAKKQGACDSLVRLKKLKVGTTYNSNTQGLIVFKELDCKTKMFRFWRPKMNNNTTDDPGKYVEITENLLFLTESKQQYHVCDECDGSGHIGYFEYTTKTKELPWGYFDGIEVKKITTEKTKKYTVCTVCHGLGIVLK